MAAGARVPLAATVFVAVASTMLLAAAAADLDGDRDALMALRRGLQDPDGALRSWSPELGNVNPCSNWSHVTCNSQANRVTEIVIGFVNLSGPLSPELGKLGQLTRLHLQQNRLTGPIPSELDGLSDQTSVNLSNNDLCGPIPTDGPFKNINSSLADNPRLGGNC
ncbi:hypothetical protein CFC21_007924 [Triticum aestivum]|uniref:Leucine-rich repeat-containing N-terminal plant-type domain-containing protein n=2 Tax=Triticum aestivum TaxID=4565 RepID=A0A3B5Z1T6_WHEAT|nr:hypothetical protein CFC21_007924 [Triticum aestivum]